MVLRGRNSRYHISQEIRENGEMAPEQDRGPEEIRRPLDKFSSYIWEICDGENTVADVVRKFDEKFGEEVAPAPDRVQIFLETLLSLNLIVLK